MNEDWTEKEHFIVDEDDLFDDSCSYSYDSRVYNSEKEDYET